MSTFKLPTLPGELTWVHQPLDWKLASDNSLAILAGEKTDWFTDPAGEYIVDSAPAALFTPPDPEFMLGARVSVDFASAFDAGILQIRASEGLWAKLCFEYSPLCEPMIVSVVTRGVSDDCNSVPIAKHEVYLRIAVTGPVIAFHYSLNGEFWHLVRYFSLGSHANLRAGFSSQSPTGRQCTAVFSEIHYRPGRLKEYRNGE